MKRLEVSDAVRPLEGSLGVKGLNRWVGPSDRTAVRRRSTVDPARARRFDLSNRHHQAPADTQQIVDNST